MVREIINPQSEEYVIRIPKEYIDTQVEILILPLSDKKEDTFFDEAELLERIETIKNGKAVPLSRDEAFDGI